MRATPPVAGMARSHSNACSYSALQEAAMRATPPVAGMARSHSNACSYSAL